MASKSMTKRLQSQSGAPLFHVQADKWLKDAASRNREPLRPKSVATYAQRLKSDILPILGTLPLDAVGNIEVNQLVNTLVSRKLSANTIQLNINIIKQIRASAVNSTGEQLYPYTWNSAVIDAPVISKKTTKRPIATVLAIQGGLSCACASQGTKLLLAVLAGTGMRIQEALALRKGDFRGTYWNHALSKIKVEEQRDKATLLPTKTEAGEREIDLPTELNEFLMTHVALGVGLMFPLSEGTYRAELIKCGVIGGFHSLRRFRTTHLRMQGVPEPLVKFWIGHEDESVTDSYTQVGTEIEKRKEQANRAGLGFVLPEAI